MFSCGCVQPLQSKLRNFRTARGLPESTNIHRHSHLYVLYFNTCKTRLVPHSSSSAELVKTYTHRHAYCIFCRPVTDRNIIAHLTSFICWPTNITHDVAIYGKLNSKIAFFKQLTENRITFMPADNCKQKRERTRAKASSIHTHGMAQGGNAAQSNTFSFLQVLWTPNNVNSPKTAAKNNR